MDLYHVGSKRGCVLHFICPLFCFGAFFNRLCFLLCIYEYFINSYVSFCVSRTKVCLYHTLLKNKKPYRKRRYNRSRSFNYHVCFRSLVACSYYACFYRRIHAIWNNTFKNESIISLSTDTNVICSAIFLNGGFSCCQSKTF